MCVLLAVGSVVAVLAIGLVYSVGIELVLGISQITCSDIISFWELLTEQLKTVTKRDRKVRAFVHHLVPLVNQGQAGQCLLQAVLEGSVGNAGGLIWRCRLSTRRVIIEHEGDDGERCVECCQNSQSVDTQTDVRVRDH